MLKRRILVYATRGALILLLSGAAWSVYRRLPSENQDGRAANASAARETVLRVVVSPLPNDRMRAANVAVELYPVDLSEAQRAFEGMPKRANFRFDDFLKRYAENKKILKAQTDARGQAILRVPPGQWWLRAAFVGDETISWRIPVTITDREQTLELTPQNAYAREKSY